MPSVLLGNGLIKDLSTLGGDNSEAIWLNEAGDVVGSADLPGPTGNQPHDAVFWTNGKIHDLGTVTGDLCSRGRNLNSRGQVVGGSSDCHNFLHAFLWENGGPMVDLNAVAKPIRSPNSGIASDARTHNIKGSPVVHTTASMSHN